ncbi:MAG: HipA domain-containing protein [Lachnospiraceae bacterium]|nr:HipA domain-containing protein [Lachnospiraceae bacterium]
MPDSFILNLSLLYSADLKSIRLAPAYDLVSTAVYDSGSEDMAFSIGGERNIHAISRKSFEKAAKEVGLGAKMAMNRFDAMVSDFEKALISAGKELKEQGFAEASRISESVLHKGGIARQ